MSQIFDFSYGRRYRGPVQAVIFDWAGTIVDYGCVAPAVVFVEVFERRQVPITMAEARAPMGAPKKDHIRAITEMESVRRRWEEAHGHLPSEADVDAMYEDFVPRQIECLSNYSALIPGTLEAVADLRKRGIKIGTNTGYSSDMTAVNLADAKTQGFEPDSCVSASDVPAGRPYPFMCLQNAIELQVDCVEACVKVDDTVPGIEEGLNAGMWSIGLAVSGNEVGLSLADWQALSEAEKVARRAQAYRRLHQAGAHFVIDDVSQLLPCIDEIGRRLARGERP